MYPRLRQILSYIGVFGILALLFIAIRPQGITQPAAVATTTQVASVAEASPAAATTSAAITTSTHSTSSLQAPKKPAAKKAPAAKKTVTPPTNEVHRIEDPYSTPPLSLSSVNDMTRAALVNIVCAPHGGSLRPISGSGVVIDPRGVILTNAHVAQYVLLSQSTAIDLKCVVRTGSPAIASYVPEVLFMPKVWVTEHAADITAEHPVGTGEHDYALLSLVSAIDGTPLPAALPYVSPDSREGIGFLDDTVLAASYPAEFVGGIAAQNNLYPTSSITTVKDLLTFNEKIDLISIGGIIEAQNGSSGGAVTNMWGHLIGIITTTSDGATTAQRDLRAITLSYIDRDLALQSGFTIATTLGGDVFAEAAEFRTNAAPHLMRLLIDQLEKRSR